MTDKVIFSGGNATSDPSSRLLKHFFAAAALAGLSMACAASGAMAALPHHATMSCKEFLTLDEVTRPRVVYWAEGLSRTGRPEDAEIDVGTTNRLIPIVTEQCREEPTASFWDKLKSSWDKLEDSVKAHL